MNVFTRPPQLTTAITDLLIAIIAAYFIIRMKGIDEPRKNRRAIWKAFMLTMLISGLGGFLIHDFKISERAVAAAYKAGARLYCTDHCIYRQHNNSLLL